MNYIKHLNQWMELVSIDDRLTPHHVSIYLALFQLWNKSRFPQKIFLCRNEVMQISKIGSSKTYYKCLHALHDYGYIKYYPSFDPMKGSAITLIDLSDADVVSSGETDEISQENEDDTDLTSSKKICLSTKTTRVDLKHNDHSTCSKNDSGSSQVVTPLYINNINLLNDKQRERRAHVNVDLNSFSFLNQKRKSVQKSKSLVKEKSSEGAQCSSPPSSSSSGNNLERKKFVPHEISIPTLAQVKDFFIHQLSGNYLNGVLNAKNREIEAEKFFNHYESNGWLLGGKVPMRNWKASCRSWVAKIPYFSRPEVKRNSFNRLHAKPVMDYAKPL